MTGYTDDSNKADRQKQSLATLMILTNQTDRKTAGYTDDSNKADRQKQSLATLMILTKQTGRNNHWLH